MFSSALGDSKDFHLSGADSRRERLSAVSNWSRVFLLRNLNTRVKRKKKTLNMTQTQTTAPQALTQRILLSKMTLGILQPLQHVSHWREGGRALCYSEQIQIVGVLLVQLGHCRDLVTEGISDRLERGPEGKRKRMTGNLCLITL